MDVSEEDADDVGIGQLPESFLVARDPFVLGAFAIVDIRRGAEPAYDFPLVIADRLVRARNQR